MAGFSNIKDDESIVYADNISFDGTERDGKITSDGQILIGSSIAPHIRVGSITSDDGSITITSGEGTIDLAGAIVTPTQYQTDSGTATPSSDVLRIFGGEGIDVTGGSNVVTVRGEDATYTNKGVASFSSTDFSVVNGEVSLAGGSGVSTLTSNSGTATQSAGNINVVGGTNGIDTSASGDTLTINFDVTEAPTIPTSVATDSGTVTPATNSFTVTGSGGIATSGSGSTLTIDGSGISGGGVISTTYTASDTWNKNANTKFIYVFGWSSGGSGGSGRRATTATSGGGAGGAGGANFFIAAPASYFNSSETVTVGAQTTGGAGQSSNSTNGNPGANCNLTSFGNLRAANSSTSLGAGGINGASTNGVGNLCYLNYAQPSSILSGDGSAGQLAAAIAATALALNNLWSSTGGGGGGGANSTTPRAGGNGGLFQTFSGATLLAGGAGGIESGTINGGNGNPAITTGGLATGGSGGGGGGGQSSGGSAGTGGNGGIPGGGGGGGGGSLNGTLSGAGGNGARGQIVVIEFT